MKKIAVTGGVASGKSSFCSYLKQLGAFVVDADSLVHQFLSPNSVIGLQIIHLLGPDIQENNKFNRKKIAQIVFSAPEKLQQLEALLHPLVKKEVDQIYNEAKKKKHPSLFVVEVPLLFEANWQDDYDVVITVMANEDKCVDRFMQSSPKQTKNNYDARILRQLDINEKSSRSDIVVNNNQTLKELKAQAKKKIIILTKKTTE